VDESIAPDDDHPQPEQRQGAEQDLGEYNAERGHHEVSAVRPDQDCDRDERHASENAGERLIAWHGSAGMPRVGSSGADPSIPALVGADRRA
jgi:hypothetical protein